MGLVITVFANIEYSVKESNHNKEVNNGDEDSEKHNNEI